MKLEEVRRELTRAFTNKHVSLSKFKELLKLYATIIQFEYAQKQPPHGKSTHKNTKKKK